MPFNTHRQSEIARLENALLVTASLIDRYQGTPFEIDAVRVFERIERERARQQSRADTKDRARALASKYKKKRLCISKS